MSVARGSKLLNYINYRALWLWGGQRQHTRRVTATAGAERGEVGKREQERTPPGVCACFALSSHPRPLSISLSLHTGMRITTNDGRQIVGR